MHATPDDPRTDGKTCQRCPNDLLSEPERAARTREVAGHNTPDERAREALCARIDAQVPAELKAQPNWVLWRYELLEDGTLKKPLYSASPRYSRPRQARVDDRRFWTSYELAVARYRRGGYAGVGFVLSGSGQFAAIDLDHCREPESGLIAPWALRVIERAASYTEVSPSGTGIHIWLTGSVPGTGHKRGPVELYDTLRYLTVTGERVPDTAATIRTGADAQEALTAIAGTIFADRQRRPLPPSSTASARRTALQRSDEALLSKASSAKNGAKFAALWQGTLTGYVSRSEAHLALISMLLYWTDGDADRVDRLFRHSGLYARDAECRRKWDERHSAEGLTYGELTIAKAREGLKAY